MKKIINNILFKLIELIEKNQYKNLKLDQNDPLKKITNINFVDKEDIYVDSPSGWVKVEEINETQPYKIYYIKTNKGKELFCADNHMLYDDNGDIVFVQDLKETDWILTKDGPEFIDEIYSYNSKNTMVDLSVDSFDRNYYTNEILSHNTITSAITILHYCIFNANKGIMIVSNKADTVEEIIDKIKDIYKRLPFFMKPGIINWNKKEIVFDNGCRIKGQPRSTEPAIGFTIDFLYMDEFAHIPSTIINKFYRAAVPTVSSITGSKIVITSTPNGANLFKDLVMGAKLPEGHPQKNQYNFISVYWDEVPDDDFILDSGIEIDGTRRDPKLFFRENRILEYGFTHETLFNVFKSAGYTCKLTSEQSDQGDKHYIRILYEPEKNITISDIRKLKIDDIEISKLFLITNWEEDETILIGGVENFNQEYNIQFLAGSKLVLSPHKAKEFEERDTKYIHTELPQLDKLKFKVPSLRFDPEFNLGDMDKYYWVTTTDMAEGLGFDNSVTIGFRLMVRPDEWFRDNPIRYLHDAFYLKQTFVVSENLLGNKTLYPELYYVLHFDILNPYKTKAVLELNGPADGMLGALPGVFNSVNEYGNYIFAKFKQKSDDVLPKIGYKVSRNKKELIKQWIDAVEIDQVYLNEEQTLDETNNFVKAETPSGDMTYRADSGYDDHIMASVGGANFLLTQDYKNMCSMYYEELPIDVKRKIDAHLNDSYSIIDRQATNRYSNMQKYRNRR